MLARWWVVLCGAAVIWDTASSQPKSRNGKSECCPCPKDSDSASDQASSPSAGKGVWAIPRAVDDCPCRDADSSGASSVFFPNAVRAVRPFVNLDSKENPDPLLHPEVNLASSVLETLRKATDEEYEEALAREAARSASDGEAAESARKTVTVIISPKDEIVDDDVMSEASHVHETRCIDPPLGKFRASAQKPSILLTDLLHLPKRKSPSFRSWKPFDMDSGFAPSNVNEQVVKPTFKDNFPDFKSVPTEKLETDRKPQSPLDKFLFKVPDLTTKINKDALSLNKGKSPSLSKLRIPTKIDLPGRTNLIPRYDMPDLLRKNDKEDVSDNTKSASILKERYTKFMRDNNNVNDLDPTKPVKTRLTFKSPSIDFGAKPNLDNLKVRPSKERDAATDFVSNLLKGLEVPNLSNLFNTDLFNQRNDDQASKSSDKKGNMAIEQNKPFATEILDAVPSPSEIKSDHVSFSEVESKGGINENINTEDNNVEEILEQNPMKTEIIDYVPKSQDFDQTNGQQTNALIDEDADANVNSFSSNERSQLNNEMEQINEEDMVDDTVTGSSDRNTQIEKENCVVENNTEFTNDMVDTNGLETSQPDLTPTLDNNQEDESPAVSNVNQDIPLRDKVRNKLESLKQRSKINLDNILKKKETKASTDDNLSQNEEPATSETSESGKLATQILDSIPSSNNPDKVNFEDLQQMSDSLLDQEKLQEDDSSLEETDTDPNTKIDLNDDTSNDISSGENEEQIDSSAMETINVLSENSNRNIDNACLETAPVTNIAVPDESLENNGKTSEMVSEASERVIDAIEIGDRLKPSLRQNIVQPPSLSDLNILNLPTLNVADVFNINNPLSNIFTARENDFSSTREEDIDDILGSQLKMSPSASSFRSSLPPLQPLEDINLDILQLKPLSPETPTLPRLNLNSFKTKLAIPENLQLRPLLLESSIGNKKGVVGASLTFGRDQKSRSNMLQQASLKSPNILGSSLGDLPSLDDLRSAMWENAQNLFNTPLETTSRNVVEDTLRSGQVLSENLRVGAEKTVKDIHRNLKSTFKGAGYNSPSLLSSPSLRKPTDLFEEISRKHEDVNDKLKGIHYDLSDRLETFRNNILEDYKLPSFGSDFFPSLGSNSLLSSPTTKSSSILNSKPSSSSFSNKGKKTAKNSNSGSKGKFTTSRSSSKNKFRMPAAASEPNIQTINSPNSKKSESPLFKNFRNEESSSFLAPKDGSPLGFLQKPEKNIIDTNKSFLKKPLLPKSLQNKVTISFSTTELPPLLKNRPRFKEAAKPNSISNKDAIGLQTLQKSRSRDNSVLPSLSKTTSKDKPWITLSRTEPRDKTLPLLSRTGPRVNTLPTLSRSASKDKWGFINSKDSSGFASEPAPSKVKAPFEERHALKELMPLRRKTAIQTEPEALLNTGSASSKANPLTKTLKGRPNSDTPLSLSPKSSMISDGTIERNSLPVKSQISRTAPLSWPKTIDDEFLTKVREALKARLAGISQNLHKNSRKAGTYLVPTSVKNDGDVDMARSASNNLDIIELGPELMKENTAYSCKMTCTKNT